MTLPNGYRVRLAAGVTTLADSTVLIGGSPMTVLRLALRARAHLTDGAVTVVDATSAHLADRLLAANLAVPDLAGVPAVLPDEVSVVLPVRDRAAQLDRALAGLAGLRCVVVDDDSLDPGAVEAVARRHGADYHHLNTNLGPAGARNAGLRQIATRYVAFVDSDVQVAAADLLALARHFADPRVAIVAPKIVGQSPAAEPSWFERHQQSDSSLTLGDSPLAVRPGAAVSYVPSACMLARVGALGAGFDASLRVAEDVDLVWRLVADGYRVRYDPAVVARHDTRTAIRAWLGRTAYYGTGAALLGQRHGDAIAPAVLSPATAIAAAAILARHPVAVPMSGYALASTSVTVRRALPDVPGRTGTAVRTAVRGLGWAVRQETGLLLRHWWPVTVVACLLSGRARRAAFTALVVDAVLLASRPGGRGSALPLAFLAKRLDEAAYGAGLWRGAVRARSATALRPRRVERVRRRAAAVAATRSPAAAPPAAAGR
jgi:mycofactocin system glycosyltransferase